MHSRNKIENSRKLHFVKNIIIHNNFSSHLLHDIAIIQLHYPIFYTNHSRPICLPEVNSSLPEHNCWISGWGYSNSLPNGSGYKGDSGGPFFCRNNNIYTLYGVASFRPPFAAPGTLTSYVRVSSHVNWITDTMKNANL
ncbi:Plasma kallikrein [Trichinella pseudospiralis]|uniref:Plasma kallikrein n=1 Tax=Trichinella pseudospiralis TaxID=6337 RepID=A0A0V0XZK8_TRIPS|nr:Plasma kallikrein [Trichinella pseudospiralis]